MANITLTPIPLNQPSTVINISDLRYNIALSGTKNSSNRIFTIPSGKFINFLNVSIVVIYNGTVKTLTTDYTVSESLGAGTGFDTITFVSIAPAPTDTLVADYVINTQIT